MKTFLRVLKIVLAVIALACFVGVIYHFFRAINLSLFENDVKTAQNRIRSAYQFLYMLASGLALVFSLVGLFAIKEHFLPKKVLVFLGLESKEESVEASLE